MDIIDNFLSVDSHTRPGYTRDETLAVTLHWVAGQAKQTALGIRNYFESLKGGPKYASVQYTIGFNGKIIRLMPDEERAYHVGHSNIVDPASGKLYTDYARTTFGKYAEDPVYSPSYCTIGIELCHLETDGRFSKETLNSAMDLCEMLFKKYKLDPNLQLTTHEKIVGWKTCPLWFHKHPEDFNDFQHGLNIKIRG